MEVKRRYYHRRRKKKAVKEIERQVLIDQYDMTPMLISQYLPEPYRIKQPKSGNAKPMVYWKQSDVERIIAENEGLKKAIKRRRDRRKAKELKARRRLQDAVSFLTQFSPENLFEQGRELERRFILHVGPTNSGKTYEALQALRAAGSGLYLGPLRLLALEVAEGLNWDGIPCTLLTGEEYLEAPGASITASTIELCDYIDHFDVAVIDEAQMLADPFRGHHWLRAITQVDAEEVHICMAPEALSIVTAMMVRLEADYEVRYHERMVPLKFSGQFHDLAEVQQGDALITFSRKKVLQMAAALEQQGINASVIYGALPPSSRREEVRRFAEKETSVVVATDAIGMGVSLPIRRVIFTDTEKFDGTDVRTLTAQEIRQIGGRAGRFGKYDLGEVLSMVRPEVIQDGLEKDDYEIDKVTIAFPSEALDYDYPLSEMLKLWDSLEQDEAFSRADMRDAEELLQRLGNVPKSVDKRLIYDLITCPVDLKNKALVSYWRSCCDQIIAGAQVLRPYFREDTLESCELKYHAYDVYHQLLRRIGVEDDCQIKKERLSLKINAFLKDEKTDFLKRCKVCGRELEITGRFNICDRCFKRYQRY